MMRHYECQAGAMQIMVKATTIKYNCTATPTTDKARMPLGLRDSKCNRSNARTYNVSMSDGSATVGSTTTRFCQSNHVRTQKNLMGQ